MTAGAVERWPGDYADWTRARGLPSALAAAGIAYQLPQGEASRIISVSFTMVTAAGGAARQVIVELLDSQGNVCFAVPAPGTQIGGLTVRYSFAGGVQPFGSAALGAMGGPFPDSWLPENLVLAVAVAGTSAADALTTGRLLVNQYRLRQED